MAYAEFGAFRPSESAFVNPGEYEKTQRAIALEKANYLSSMDSFYKDLEEKGREFDLTLGLEKERLGFEKSQAAEQSRQFEMSFGLQRDTFEETKRQFEAMFGIEQEKVGLQEEALAQSESQFAADYAIKQGELALEDYMAQLKQEELAQEQSRWETEFQESQHQFEENVRLKEEEIAMGKHGQSSDDAMSWLTGGMDIIGGIGGLFG